MATETPSEQIRALKTAAKNQRDRGIRGYPRAEALLREAIAIGEAELRSSSVPERRVEMAGELSDSYGLIGGVQRRWADETAGAEHEEHLKSSTRAYDDGFGYESDPQYGLVNSYNLVNRLLVRLIWDPEALAAQRQVVIDGTTPALNLAAELDEAASTVRGQLARKRRGDHWAMADLALLELLLERGSAASAYADFVDASPRDFEYESALATVRPLASLPLASAESLRDAVNLLEDRLKRLRS